MKKLIFQSTIVLILFYTGYINAQIPVWNWARTAGGSGDDYGVKVDVDDNGNVFLAGNFNSDTIIFGSDTLYNFSGDDFFIAKYDSAGNLLWIRQAGGNGNETMGEVVTDNSGNAYITGATLSDTVYFGSDTLFSQGNDDIVVAKIDGLGNWLWTKILGDSGDDRGRNIAVNANGVYVSGFFKSSVLIIGNDTLYNPSTSSDIFIAHLDTNGNEVWGRRYGAGGHELGNGIGTDPFGYIYQTGYISDTIAFGNDTLIPAGNNDIFLVKHDPAWNVIWARSAGGTGFENGIDLCVDDFGNPSVSGVFTSPTITFAGMQWNLSGGQFDLLILHYDSAGNEKWGYATGNSVSGDSGADIAVDSDGNVYVTGQFNGTISFGSNLITSSGFLDIYVVCFDSTGNDLWALNPSGDSGADLGSGICTDNQGNIYLTGNYSSSGLGFGATSLSNSGGIDVFLTKLNTGITPGILPAHIIDNEFFIYPNPATELLRVKSNKAKFTLIEVYNMIGEKVICFGNHFPSLNASLEIGQLSEGMYFLKVYTDKGSVAETFIKQE